MGIINQNWYNLQSTRSYPIDDRSTCVDDAGTFIPNDIIVDCHIKFPRPLGACLYVQGVTSSAGLLTIVFGAANDFDAATGHTVAVVSLLKPVSPYVNYSVTGLVPGISGWVVFGTGVSTEFTGRYSTPKQTALAPRCARPYTPLPVSTIGKQGLNTALSGLVNLRAASPVVVNRETITVLGKDYPALVFRLDRTQLTTSYNPFTALLTTCGERPESGTCPKPPIETINGVEPDCDGNIDIEFVGFTANSFEDCGGIDLLTNVGLAEVCAANDPTAPKTFTDACCTQGGDEYCWPDPTTAIVVVDETVVNTNLPCLKLPVCFDFGSCDESPYFETRAGNFDTVQTSAPALCPCAGNTNETTALTEHYTHAAVSAGGFNISVLKNCPTDWATGRQISVELNVSTDGVERNGGLLLNYRQTKLLQQIVTTFIAVVVDVTHACVRVLSYNGSAFIIESTTNFNFKPNKWYRISATITRPNPNSSAVVLNFTVTLVPSNVVVVSGTTTLVNAGDVTGLTGLFANRSYTFFNKLEVR